MLTIRFILLLSSVNLGSTKKGFHQNSTLVYVNEGDNITITCIYQRDTYMHFSWYKHNFSHKPELIATIYKYDEKATFYDGFKNNTRFTLVNINDGNQLVITDLEVSDSATYYCGKAMSNLLKFGEGTKLIVKASQYHSLYVLQKPVLEAVQPGNPVTLQCTVFAESCAGAHGVYWFRHGSGESHPGIIYTHGNSIGQREMSSDAGLPTQSCMYELSMQNLSFSDAGTYYCAVSVCGEIIFGNGAKLDIKDLNTSWNLTTLALGTSNIICVCVIVILGILLRKHWQKSAAYTTQPNQAEDAVNYASLSFAQRPHTSRRTVETTNQHHSLYSQVKIHQQH
ncbi:signal-regulatory protein beta-2-like [Brachyhypopomus gauderio]|uniref:signal-regulatory protein beta-2-like n=1 Tax=Brachyhypopomus gauderio TaxID=698409 RepID=UPI0040417747